MKAPLLARAGLSLDRLASFLSIVDSGGIAAAADADPVRQSQLSRQLKELEEFFGKTLIEGRRGRFRLTAAGLELTEIARTSLTRLNDFERRCAGGLVEVHLGAGESVLVWMLLPRLDKVMVHEPKVVFTLHNLRSEEIVARLRDGRLDFGILRRQSIQPGLKSLTLKSVRYALFLPTHLAGTHSTDDVAASLGKVSFAMLEGTAEINTALAQWAETQGVRVQAPLRCTSLIQVAEAVKQLGMAAVLPTWAESALDPQRVVRFELPSLTKLGAPMRLVWSKRQSGVRTFLDRLAKLIESNLVR